MSPLQKAVACVTAAALLLGMRVWPQGVDRALPGDSLYQLPITLTAANGQPLDMRTLRGKPRVVTMFYSHCSSVCPLLTSQVQRIVGALSAAERRQIRVLMVSFDSLRDDPAALAEFEEEHHIRGSNWIVARASEGDVRALAAALGIRYRELDDHTFNHSAVISVTDRQGTVRARTSGITSPDPSFVASIRTQIAAAASP
jgi:protein SCO1